MAKRDDKDSPALPIVRRLAEAILEIESFAQDAGKKLYVFRGGTYTPRGEETIRRLVKRLTVKWKQDHEWSTHLANEVVEYVRLDAPDLWERPPMDVVNVKNGLLRIRDRKLLPHTPRHLSVVQLPVEYDKAATCDHIDLFAKAVFPADSVSLAYEIVAFLMLPDTSIQKAVLLLGPGGNGKSTYLQMVLAFLGRANTSAVALHSLEADKFKAARLYGKLANVCADLPSEHLEGTSVFKAITGGDVLSGERKFQDSFDFYPFARLLFSANSAPRSKDASQGFFDRWLVINFLRSFRGTGEEIPRDVLDAMLSEPAQLSGLLNKALDALPVLKEQKGFTQTQSIKDAWRDFHATTDPLAVWLERFTVTDSDAVVTRDALRVAFNAHLEQQGRPSMTREDFGRAFNKLRPDVEAKQRMVNGKLQWCYIGIGLTPISEPHSQDSRDSQDNSGLFLSQATVEAQQEEVGAYPVKGVNGVKCNHVDPSTWEARGERVVCPVCERFMGMKRRDQF